MSVEPISYETSLSRLYERSRKCLSGQINPEFMEKGQIYEALYLRLDGLRHQRIRTGSSLLGGCPGGHATGRIKINGKIQDVHVHIEETVKAFGFFQEVVILPQAGKRPRLNPELMRLYQLRQWVLVPEEELPFQSNNEPGKPMAPIGSIDLRLVTVHKMKEIARQQQFCLRLSKKCFPELKYSMHVLQNGFVATDTKEVYRIRDGAKQKTSITARGERVSRRTEKFDVLDPVDRERILRRIKILSDFMNEPGIFPTYAFDVYVNTKGIGKLISFHPIKGESLLYPLLSRTEHDRRVIREILYRPNEQERLAIAHQILIGLNTIAKKGIHLRLCPTVFVLLKTEQSYNLWIQYLDAYFQYHGEKSEPYRTPGLDEQGIERQVWDAGCILFYVLRKEISSLPWNKLQISEDNLIRVSYFTDLKTRYLKEEYVSEEIIKTCIKTSGFSPKIETLLLGMLELDPKKRWTAEQALHFFEDRKEEEKKV